MQMPVVHIIDIMKKGREWRVFFQFLYTKASAEIKNKV